MPASMPSSATSPSDTTSSPAWLKMGPVYVSDYVNHRIQKFDTSGKFLINRVFGAQAGPGVVWRFTEIPFMTLEVGREDLRKILIDESVVSVQEDGVSESMLNQSADVIQADKVWNTQPTLRGKGQAIAILDTGTEHQTMLRGRVVAGACFSTNYAYYPSQSLCSGQISSEIGVSAGKNCPTTIGGCDHGTHVGSGAEMLRFLHSEATICHSRSFASCTSGQSYIGN